MYDGVLCTGATLFLFQLLPTVVLSVSISGPNSPPFMGSPLNLSLVSILAPAASTDELLNHGVHEA